MMQVVEDLQQLPMDAAFDIAVVGAGGAGMATSLFAALAGRRVLLVERSGFVGGTTALSAGSAWVPGTHHAAQVNPNESLADASRYLAAAIGERTPATLRQAFLDHGAEAIRLLEDHSAVRFRPYPRHPDYLSEISGSTLAGRALEPLPFDGRLLGRLFARIRPPIPEFTVLGGMMVDRTDIQHLLGLRKSFHSFRHALRILVRHGIDRLRHPRGTRLVMGNALVARLLYSLSSHPNVTLLLNTGAKQFLHGAQGVTGLQLAAGGTMRELTVPGGVVLASGGFTRHHELRRQFLPGADIAWSPTSPGTTGETHALARDAGAMYGTGAVSHAYWAPVSLRTRADGSTAVFPHFVMDRAKPGMMTVNRAGQRFVNESTSYHLFGLAMQATGSVPAFLVCDAQALHKYGVGMVRPGAGAKDLEPFLADAYLTQGATPAELALKLGIDGAGLLASLAQINECARTGVDPHFQRGTTAYQHNIGDTTAGTVNPNLGPLSIAPYYAVRLYPGDIGAATGFATDSDARVLDGQGRVIAGLYAVGNDMHSIMGGVYTGPGITIGPGLVFAYLAARHATRRTQ